MPDIGASLREARMRARIDITEIEAQTKIRAKYLRALENEEWDLLPGPTYVKTFLRTYAEALGLDGRTLVEEYKLRHERLSDVELQPIAPRGTRTRDRPPRRGFPRAGLVAIVVVGLVIALYALGRGTNDSPDVTTPATTVTAQTTPARTTTQRTTATTPAAPRTATLRVIPTRPVNVCLRAAGDRTLIPGQTLVAGAGTQTYRSSRFTFVLGNSGARLRINGRTRAAPESSGPAGYEVTRSGRLRTLPQARWPRCGA
jgi:cytoskeletal protein RodZ